MLQVKSLMRPQTLPACLWNCNCSGWKSKCVDLEQQTAVNIDVPLAWQGPARYAQRLMHKFPFNEEQINLIALLVLPLEKAWQNRHQKETYQLPHGLGLSRVLLVGGGGCGRTTIVLKVMKPLLLVYFGHNGVQLAAPSNKAARLIEGKTVHNLVGLKKGDSLKTYDLNLSRHKERKKLDATLGQAGALVLDEFSQLQSFLFHAAALRATVCRADCNRLNINDYARPYQTFGKITFLLLCGDHLQLPPVPKSSSLLSKPDDGSSEHKAAVAIFRNIPKVLELQTAMRFQDTVLISILQKMRAKGSAKLTDSEWLALCKTKLEDRTEELTSAEFLEKTNDWYHTCYLWNIVGLIAFVRVRTAAKLAAKTMFYSQANDLPDKPLSPEQLKELLGVANLSTTSKLPGVNLFFVGQRIRLTKQVLAPWAVQDATGTIVHINFAEPLPETLAAECVVHMPKAIYVKFDSLELEFLPPRPCNQHLVFHAGCNEFISFPGVVQVTPQTDVWTYKLSDSLSVRVKRTSFPILPEKACSLYTMQGTTATPGMVAHFDMPRMTPPDLICTFWRCTYCWAAFEDWASLPLSTWQTKFAPSLNLVHPMNSWKRLKHGLVREQRPHAKKLKKLVDNSVGQSAKHRDVPYRTVPFVQNVIL